MGVRARVLARGTKDIMARARLLRPISLVVTSGLAATLLSVVPPPASGDPVDPVYGWTGTYTYNRHAEYHDGDRTVEASYDYAISLSGPGENHQAYDAEPTGTVT